MNSTTSALTNLSCAEPMIRPGMDGSCPGWTREGQAGPGTASQSTRLRRLLRLAFRLPAFIGVVTLALADMAFRNRPRSVRSRCAWLSHWSRRTLRVLHLEASGQGCPPQRGLLVSNHLGYLDILVLASQQPMVFVAKSEVRRWPLVGWLARLAGTIFIDRSNRSDVARLNAELAQLVEENIVVALFPEGTSSGGDTVLPFFSSLLAPAAENQWPVTPAGLAYELEDGSVEAEVCYWRDMSFVPHLLNLLTKRSVRARVNYGAATPGSPDRKALARHLQGRVRELKAEIQCMASEEAQARTGRR